jgi:hypothetical protein
MRALTVCATAVLGLAAAASADVIGNAQMVNSYAIGRPAGGSRSPSPGAGYSNITTFTGFVVANGSATVQAGNDITALLADDCVTIAPGMNVTQFSFSVGNGNSVTVTARPRVRFWANDGTGGAPGTFLAGFTFNPISFTASNVGLFSATIAAGSLIVPANGVIWAGMTFDDNTGTTGATAAQLNNLGQGTFNPVDVGSSADRDFLTSAAGSFLVNNPTGAIRPSPFGANPVANYAWEFVPAPSSLGLLGLGGLLAARRRR